MEPSAKPTRKVTVGLAANSAVALLAWILKLSWGIEIPAEQALSIMTLVTFVLQYAIPDSE